MRYTKTKKKTGNRRLKKRWYLSAGATLPFVGKTTIDMGSGNKVKRSIVNVVRAGLEEPLHKLWSRQGVSAPQVSIFHNTIYTFNLTGNIPQGTSDFNRSGDTIHLEALKMNLHLSTAGAANVNKQKRFRVMLVKCDLDVLGGSDSFGSGIGATDLFFGNNNVTYEQKNPKNCHAIFDKTYTITPQIGSTTDYSLLVSEIINFKQKFIYKSGTNFGKYYNYYLLVMGDEQNATPATQIGYGTFYGDLIFKDSK